MQGHWTGEPVGPDEWVTCRKSIPAGSVFAFLAEHREKLFPGGMFADMYPCTEFGRLQPHDLRYLVQSLGDRRAAPARRPGRPSVNWPVTGRSTDATWYR
jgi:hypothetical protein